MGILTVQNIPRKENFHILILVVANTRGIPAIEIIGGKILMVNWRIRAAANGTLQVERFVERGPDPIEVFDFREHSFKENIHKKCDD